MSLIPPDDPSRHLALSDVAHPNLPYLAIAGGTYTILVTGKDTAGRYCVIDLIVPAGAGPAPHRHDFEETFTVLEGEIEAEFRGVGTMVRAGQTVHIPANAPHRFLNRSQQDARVLCVCAPAGLEEFFLELGTPVATRTARPPALDPAEQAAFRARAAELAPKYGIELVQHT